MGPVTSLVHILGLSDTSQASHLALEGLPADVSATELLWVTPHLQNDAVIL